MSSLGLYLQMLGVLLVQRLGRIYTVSTSKLICWLRDVQFLPVLQIKTSYSLLLLFIPIQSQNVTVMLIYLLSACDAYGG